MGNPLCSVDGVCGGGTVEGTVRGGSSRARCRGDGAVSGTRSGVRRRACARRTYDAKRKQQSPREEDDLLLPDAAPQLSSPHHPPPPRRRPGRRRAAIDCVCERERRRRRFPPLNVTADPPIMCFSPPSAAASPNGYTHAPNYLPVLMYVVVITIITTMPMSRRVRRNIKPSETRVLKIFRAQRVPDEKE